MGVTELNTKESLQREPLKAQVSLTPLSLPSPQTLLVVGAIIVAGILSIVSYHYAGFVQGLLLWIGLLLGFTLFHARFGFTSAFRNFLAVGNGQAIRAHMILLATATTLFAIIFATKFSLFGTTPVGNISPVGTSLIVGSFIFGIGMQLGNGCASGTLYNVGGGRLEMIITLLFFIIGSVIGAWHFDFWMNDTPSLPAISLAETTGFGYFGGWLVQMALFTVIFLFTLRYEKKRQAPLMKPLPTEESPWKRIFRGSWPLWVAALMLAVLNALTLVTRGHPWGVTSAFALWGSKVALFLGIDVTNWAFWAEEKGIALERSVFHDTTSVMNFGILLGAFIAATLGGIFKPKRVQWKTIVAAVIGGLLMGYGARLAFGCNIGAYFSGIASMSVHGWVWAVFALAGSYIALYLRPLFGLSVPKKNDHFC
ncbi:MAG TPA: YeeE/YedE family protein [Bacillota bacterium]